MLALAYINRRQKRLVEGWSYEAERNTFLLEVLSSGSFATYTKFVDCLLRTRQDHVVSLFAPDIAGNARPLNELQSDKLLRSHADLVESIDTRNSRLLAVFFSHECITWRQIDNILSGNTHSECNSRLLDIISRGSEQGFFKFMDCLDECNQGYVNQWLSAEPDGALAHIFASNWGTGDIRQYERRVVENFKSLLRDTTPENRDELVDEVSRYMIGLTTFCFFDFVQCLRISIH